MEFYANQLPASTAVPVAQPPTSATVVSPVAPAVAPATTATVVATTTPPPPPTNKKTTTAATGYAITMIVLSVAWALLGFIAFVWSLVCFSATRSGNTSSKVIGLLIAMILGPFYWVYFLVRKDYCRTSSVLSGGRKR